MKAIDQPARELPGWLKATIFAVTLLAVMWLVMWIDAASR
jgi:hypothetical protein